MKSKVLIASLIFLSATIAKADGHEPTKMNFNQMIDENHQGDTDLNQALSDHYKESPATASKMEAKDETSVDDFITYEVVHLKKTPVADSDKPIIKRVYNSVEPESVD